MIFRDKKTGTLLNIHKDDYINDRTYFREIIRVNSYSDVHGDVYHENGNPMPRYRRSFDELYSKNNYT